MPVAPSKSAQAVLTFTNGWEQSQTGDLIAGGQVKIEYDVARLPNLRHSDSERWGIEAFVMFGPSGAVHHGPVRNGSFTCLIPAGATELQVWFKNWVGAADQRRESFDSRNSDNYRFAVTPLVTRGILNLRA